MTKAQVEALKKILNDYKAIEDEMAEVGEIETEEVFGCDFVAVGDNVRIGGTEIYGVVVAEKRDKALERWLIVEYVARLADGKQHLVREELPEYDCRMLKVL